MQEVWKDITEFKGVYQVSNTGLVRRIGDYSNQNGTWNVVEPYILTPRKNSHGYLRVMLSVNGNHYDRYIHRLVAVEFCVNHNPQKYTEVNHIDGDKENNCAQNLEWCDRSYNNKHAYINGLHHVHGCYGRKKRVAQIDKKTNQVIMMYDSVQQATDNIGLKNFANISACCNYLEHPERYKRPCLSAKGYKWMFATKDMKVGDVVSFL